MDGRTTIRFQPWSTIDGRSVLLTWLSIDFCCVVASTAIAMALLERDFNRLQGSLILIMAGIQLLAFIRLGVYRSLIVYTGINTLAAIVAGVAITTIAVVTLTYFAQLPNSGGLGRVFLVLEALMATMLCGGLRLIARLVLERKAGGVGGKGKRTLIYGAGSLGESVLRQMLRHPDFDPIGFIEADSERQGRLIHGRIVHGGLDRLGHLAATHHPELLVIAVAGLSSAQLKRIFDACMEFGIQVKVVKGMAESLARIGTSDLEDIALEDLLRRPPRVHDTAPVRALLAGKVVLVTGAGGSIGRELSLQIAKRGVAKIILLDQSEFNLYEIENQVRRAHPDLEVEAALLSLESRETLETLIAVQRPHIVFHAAAYKHVPMVELNPFSGMANNLGGFANLLDIATRHAVERLVMISTDKAVKPTNVMGASKRACEMLLQNCDARGTKLCAVRFGNVLGSSGSVVPLFLEQIARGGPVTVTHPDVTRYFMLIPEAVELVLQAAALAEDREIFILDMGSPVKIVNLARQLIYMTGHIPDQDMPIVFSGLRPGEKLYEELLLEGSERGTTVNGLTVARSVQRDHLEVSVLVQELLQACRSRDIAGFIDATQKLVPDWTPSDLFLDFIDGPTERYVSHPG
ncbi:MAG: polysaccharide biosynthesis protein [Planctomycetes bacterium]|nr:polysaccharide biosynthesis protein [Planctomycetota bacterium]